MRALYTRDYFRHVCGGCDEYRRSGGAVLPPRLARALALSPPRPGRRVLDLGTGRGEVPRHLAAGGDEVWALDSSPDAVAMARQTRAGASPEARSRLRLLLADAVGLPFASGRFDAVFMLDVVEHLSLPQLRSCLRDVRRVLRPGGCLILHTMPNLWYYRWTYPVYRVLAGLPRDPRDRVPLMREMHVNEQTPSSLRRCLRAAGFRARAWPATSHRHEQEPRAALRAVMNLGTRTPGLRAVLCNEIFAVASR
jgi:SAM-dependent methyltransferase